MYIIAKYNEEIWHLVESSHVMYSIMKKYDLLWKAVFCTL